MKKLLCGVAALTLALSCSLAYAGELGLKVDVGMDISVVESIDSEIEGHDLLEYRSLAVAPRVSVTKQFTEEWSASFKFRAVVGFEDDDAEMGGEDGEADFQEIDIGGSGGYTLKLNEQFSVTPVFGFTWRSYEVDGDTDAGNGKLEAGLLILDFGAGMAFRLNEQVAITGRLMFGVPLAGDAELHVPGPDADADIDGGFIFEIGGGVEYRVKDNIALLGE